MLRCFKRKPQPATREDVVALLRAFRHLENRIITLESNMTGQIDTLIDISNQLLASNQTLLTQTQTVVDGIGNLATVIAQENANIETAIANLPQDAANDPRIAALITAFTASRDATNQAAQTLSASATTLATTTQSASDENSRLAAALNPAPPAGPTITGFDPTAGNVGDTVTINGTGFGSDATAVSVTFSGDAVATVGSVSDTAIVVTVPGGALSGTVQVAVAGASVTSADQFTVNTP